MNKYLNTSFLVTVLFSMIGYGSGIMSFLTIRHFKFFFD
jgi:hypothetical protein